MCYFDTFSFVYEIFLSTTLSLLKINHIFVLRYNSPYDNCSHDNYSHDNCSHAYQPNNQWEPDRKWHHRYPMELILACMNHLSNNLIIMLFFQPQENFLNPFTLKEYTWSDVFENILTKTPDIFGDIVLTKAISSKYLKENCSSQLHLQPSFKYFVNLCFILKLFSKVWKVQTTLVKQTKVLRG